jgi:hydroxyethylthiazole kinase
VQNGHALLRTITGSGDMASALIGACLAAENDTLLASTSGLMALGLAGEHAGAEAPGPGTFRARLLDSLYNLTAQQVIHEGRITIGAAEVEPDGAAHEH